MFLDFREQFIDVVNSLVLDRHDQVGGLGKKRLAHEAQAALDPNLDRLDTSSFGRSTLRDLQHEQALAGRIDPGDSQVGPDDPAILDELRKNAQSR